MKKYFIGALCMLILCTGFSSGEAPAPSKTEFYDQIVTDLDIIQVIDSADLTAEALENRNGNIIIEKCIGTVTSYKGEGKVLNCADVNYNYISYACVENANIGDIILTYFVYNPDSNGVDDILCRFDYIIDK